jgi:hypothetical protein
MWIVLVGIIPNSFGALLAVDEAGGNRRCSISVHTSPGVQENQRRGLIIMERKEPSDHLDDA